MFKLNFGKLFILKKPIEIYNIYKIKKGYINVYKKNTFYIVIINI